MCLAYKIFLPTHQAAVHQCFNSKYLKELYGRASIIISTGTKESLQTCFAPSYRKMREENELHNSSYKSE